METVQLHQSLTFLAYATSFFIVIIGIMLVKLIFDLSKLTQNINETTTIIKTELEPTLKNVNKSVEIISGIILKTNEGVQKVKGFFSKTPFKIIGGLTKFTGKATKGFFEGLITAFKLFYCKKKK